MNNETTRGPNGIDRTLTRYEIEARLASTPKRTQAHRLWSGVLSHVGGGGLASIENGWIRTTWGTK